MNIQEITPSQIVRAYSGKIGCMCGCKGKYYTSVADDPYSNINPGMVTRILRTIQAAPPEEIKVNVEPNCMYLAWVKGVRQYVAYLTD